MFDAFIKLDGIKGESHDSKHKGEIDIVSFDLGASQQGSSDRGGGGGTGRAALRDFTFVKRVDSSTPILFLNCATGTKIPEANVVIRKAGGDQLEYLKYKLKDVHIASVKPQGAAEQDVLQGHTGDPTGRRAGGDDTPLEEVSLVFHRIEISYQLQGPDGKPQGGAVTAGWDVKLNARV